MIRFGLTARADAIVFPDDDAGERLDHIEAALSRATGLRREREWSTPLEDIRLLSGPDGGVLLRWDGFMTEVVVAQSSRVTLTDIVEALARSDAFTPV